MRFGKTLRESVYPPWKEKYIDYGKLKRLLRDDEDDGSDAEGGEMGWTEEDENRFCDEIFNVQLEKVAQFQETQVEVLKEKTESIFAELKELGGGKDGDDDKEEGDSKGKATTDSNNNSSSKKEKSEITVQRFQAIEKELDGVLAEIKELKRYSSLNYTGFLKIVKKHDRKRGNRYKVRPMMQVSLTRRPFNSEAGYAPLLAKLSLMYDAVHQYLHPDDEAPATDLEAHPEIHGDGERYTAHTFWIHPDNLLEVKTMVLRHLPALVYSDSASKEADAAADPTVTSLYFDNDTFALYNKKLDESEDGASLRLRWYGPLTNKPELFLDEKHVHRDGTSEEHRIAIKDKYVKPFLDGNYAMEKTIQKMERQGNRAETVEAFRQTAQHMQQFVREQQLEPVVRANYVRTAFQKPSDDRVRVSIDTQLAFVREDTLDRRRPCRDPSAWHRRDLDSGEKNSSYPFAELPSSDVSLFPFAVLEIKLHDVAGRRPASWVEDLMASHLVHPAPRFSKFAHGVAVLFDDYVNRLPFWLSDLDRDIRRDPQEAFAEEELRKQQRAADEQAVGSLLGTTGKFTTSSYKAAKSSPAAKPSSSYLADRMASEVGPAGAGAAGEAAAAGGAAAADATPESEEPRRTYGAISSVLPSFSVTRYATWRRHKDQQQNAANNVVLPEGVVEPQAWIKNDGPLRIEPKVWLANERTFLKWQHICVLLGSLAVALLSAADGDPVLTAMGIVYVVVAAFTGFWGWYMLRTRRDMIVARSGRDFDNMVGPVVVSVALMIALVLNLGLAYRSAAKRWDHDIHANVTSEELRL